MKKFKWLHGASAIAVVTSFLATDAMAQSLVDEITVTATKREENIQDVPIAVSAYSGALLEASGANDIRELTSVSPSLTVAATQSEATGVNARIRGVGTVGDNPGLQSAVGVFIDEVYRSRNSVALGDLGEIEGVEIARGPQGTLFGRNSSAGAIIVRTKQPEFENSGYIEGTYGSFDNVRVSGGLTGPLVENLLAGRVNVSWEQRDGYIEDLNGGDDLNDRDRVQARGQLLFEPSDEVSVRFIADYAKREENCCGAVSIVNGPLQGLANALGGGAEVDPPNPSALVASVTPGRGYQQDVDEWGVSTQVNWALPFGDLVSITAYRDWEVVRSQDVDYSTADIAFRPEDGFTNGFETFTQELRLSGETGPLEWIFGGFYSKEDVTLNDQLSVGAQYEAFFDTLASGLAGAAVDISAITSLPDGAVFGPGGIASQNDNHNVESTSWAIFTSQTLNVTDRLAVTAGVRYTEEDIDYSSVLSSTNTGCGATIGSALAPGNPINGLLGSGAVDELSTILGLACIANIHSGIFLGPISLPIDGTYSDNRKEEEVTWDATVSYDVTDNILGYAKYATGYKAGGFNMDRAGLDNPLNAVAAALLSSPVADDPATVNVENGIPEASDLQFAEETVETIEVGVKSTWFDGNASLNVVVFNQEFENYQLNSFTGTSFVVQNIADVKSTGVEVEGLASPRDGLIIQSGLTYADTRYGDGAEIPSFLQGRRVTLAPLWVATTAVTYRKPIAGTDLESVFHIDARFDSGSNTGSDLDVEKIQDEYVVFNGRIGLASLENGWSAEVFARNMFDEDYVQVAFDRFAQTGSFSAFPAEPRTYGVTLRANF